MRSAEPPLPPDPRAPLLVRAPNWIGDCVLALPVIDALRRLRPEAPLDVATRAPALSVFDGHPAVDRRIELPARRRRDGDAVRALRGRGYGAAIVLSPSFRSALQLWRARIPRRVGFADDMRGPLLTHVVGHRRGRPPAHQVRDYLDVALAVGARAADPRPRLRPPADAVERAEAVARRLGAGRRPVVCVAPFTEGGPTKRWPEERFAQLGVALARRGVHVAVIGGPADTLAARRLTDVVEREVGDGAATMLAGPHTVPIVTLAALARRLAVLVSNDTGPMHAWAAGGGRVVAIFGSSLPALHGPLGPDHCVLHDRSLPCAGCYKRRCPIGLPCLLGIPVEAALAATLEILERDDR